MKPEYTDAVVSALQKSSSRERLGREPVAESALLEMGRVWAEVFEFVEMPISAIGPAFEIAETKLMDLRPLNLGDVISAWLSTFPESDQATRLIG